MISLQGILSVVPEIPAQNKLQLLSDDMKALMSMKEDLAEIRKIVTKSNERLGPINQRIENLEHENERIWQEMDQIKDDSWELSARLDQLEQYT